MSAVAVLRLDLRPSRALAAMILGAHLVAAWCLYLVVAEIAGLALAALTVMLGAAIARDRAFLRGARAPRTLELRGDGSASVALAGGRCHPVAAGGRAGRHWVIVVLQGVARRHLLVTSDMLEAESFRRLRLWALWGRLPTGEAAGPVLRSADEAARTICKGDGLWQ